MKKSIAFIFLFVLFFHAAAEKVDTSLVRKVAVNFLLERIPLHREVQGEEVRLQLVNERKSTGGQALYYIFNIVDQKGFILVSADDEVFPVLAYSFESSFKQHGDMPEALKEWLELTEKQIRFILREKPLPGKEVKTAWSRYLVPPAKGALDIQDVAPLLTTRWNQGKYYNTLCPEDPAGRDGHVWVGCVAVAMAQVMKYWNYPDYGSGEHAYNHYTYGEQSADFVHTFYDWSAMPDALSDYNTPVATLMYHCGVSIDMNYGTSGSRAALWATARALKEYYDYSRHIATVYRSAFTAAQWDSLVRSQIDVGQPLIYAGGSHAFNIDGYQGSNYFHVNWGWGGAYNGYFYLDDLTPGSYDFTSGQHAVINIRPDCGEASPETDTVTGFSGTLWDNGYDHYNYLNCSDSRILIAPPGAIVIHLSFRDFSTVAGQDSLYVYDGEDEEAPLLLALTGDTLPDDLMTSSGKVFLHFVSDGFTTARGYEIGYTSSTDDVGVTQILLPVSRTCGRQEDSLVVVVKNYGISTQTDIPVMVEVSTPRGTETYMATLPGPLASDERDTLFAGLFDTGDPGEYHLTCYTRLAGDSLIHENDTAKKTVFIKAPDTIPFFENVDSLGYSMGDWQDTNGYTWINRDQKEGNAFFTSMPGDRYQQFFIYDRRLEPVTAHTGIWFDYRVRAGEQWPQTPVTLNSGEKIHLIVSSDCGGRYDTLFTIDHTNHIPDTLFRRVFVPLSGYEGEGVIIGFTTECDSGFIAVDYDNILVADALYDNVISGSAICEGEALHITGSAARGGLGKLIYRWEQSADGITWTSAAHPGNTRHYDTNDLISSAYFRRIVTDSLFLADTSNVLFVRVVPWPVPVITPDTAVCQGDTLLLTLSGGESYHWNTGDTGSSLPVTPGEDTKYTVVITNAGLCAVDTSVTVTVYPLPEPVLHDTAVCRGESVVLDAGDFAGYLWNTGATSRTIEVGPQDDTQYSVSVTDGNACQGEATVSVTVHPLPEVSLGPDTSACNGESITLDAGNFAGYLWNTGSQERQITVTTAGEYYVTVHDLNGCDNTDTVYVEFLTCTGTGNRQAGEEKILIYPNPSSGIFHIKGLKREEIVKIAILSAGGRVVREIKPDGEMLSVNLEDQPSGIYFIRIVSKKGSAVIRMISLFSSR